VWELGFLAVNTIVTGMLIGITQSGSGPGKNEVQPYGHPMPVSPCWSFIKIKKLQMDRPQYCLYISRRIRNLRRSHDVRLP
jgi:hypothetical protein